MAVTEAPKNVCGSNVGLKQISCFDVGHGRRSRATSLPVFSNCWSPKRLLLRVQEETMHHAPQQKGPALPFLFL